MTTRREYLAGEGIPADEIVGVLIKTGYPVARVSILTFESVDDWLASHDMFGSVLLYTLDVIYEQRTAFQGSTSLFSYPRNPAGVPRRGE